MRCAALVRSSGLDQGIITRGVATKFRLVRTDSDWGGGRGEGFR